MHFFRCFYDSFIENHHFGENKTWKMKQNYAYFRLSDALSSELMNTLKFKLNVRSKFKNTKEVFDMIRIFHSQYFCFNSIGEFWYYQNVLKSKRITWINNNWCFNKFKWLIQRVKKKFVFNWIHITWLGYIFICNILFSKYLWNFWLIHLWFLFTIHSLLMIN